MGGVDHGRETITRSPLTVLMPAIFFDRTLPSADQDRQCSSARGFSAWPCMAASCCCDAADPLVEHTRHQRGRRSLCFPSDRSVLQRLRPSSVLSVPRRQHVSSRPGALGSRADCAKSHSESRKGLQIQQDLAFARKSRFRRSDQDCWLGNRNRRMSEGPGRVCCETF